MTLTTKTEDHVPLASADTILASHFSLVSQPGAVDHIDVEGVDGWTSPHPHPVLSLMRWVTTDEAKAAAALDEILDRFREKGQGFDWMTGPTSVENNLLPILEDRGFITPPLQIAAMARQITPHDMPPDADGVHVRKLTDPKDSEAWKIMADGFDVPDDVGGIFHDAYMTPSHLQESDAFVADVHDSDTPVGVGYLSYIGDGPGVLMRVSATLEGFRGRGIYRSLVTRRLFEAAQRGRTQAYVHAYSKESQRGLRDLGFSNVGTLNLYRWRP
jgi:GNAT superfamily N-acetyltransferase